MTERTQDLAVYKRQTLLALRGVFEDNDSSAACANFIFVPRCKNPPFGQTGDGSAALALNERIVSMSKISILLPCLSVNLDHVKVSSDFAPALAIACGGGDNG